MKHLITLIQIIIWIIIDSLMFLYFLKFNMFLKNHGHSFKKNNYGIVSYINNYERSRGVKHLPNKYKAALLL